MFGICYSECLMHIADIFHWKLCNVTQAYFPDCRILNIGTMFFSQDSLGNIKFPRTSRHWGISIFQVYSDCEYSREILNMSENSLNKKIVRTLYISKGYSIFGGIN